ncbi:MAG: OmpA family protein [Bryobacterales bacterium]|nr:OmpA family protein [Bryobacterales bacterium]
MSRRRRAESHGNHERWLVSYADFVTLLFAFFVMLYAHSKTNTVEAQRISQAFREAMEQGRVSQAISRMLKVGPGPNVPAPAVPLQQAAPPAHEDDIDALAGAVDLMPSLHQLNDKLQKEISEGRLEIRMERRGLVISLREATLFPSGGEIVEASTLPMLEVIAREVRTHPNPIRMEGHTDSVPIRTARFRSNWELSAARAIAMLELYSQQFGLDRSRMSIGGFGDTAPVASNDTQEGRNRNRRVDIVVLNEVAAAQDPKRPK